MDLFSNVSLDVEIQKNLEDDRHYKDFEDNTITLATAGSMWTISPTIKLKGYVQYILKAEFPYIRDNDNIQEYRHKSRVGIWVALADKEVTDRIGSYHYPVNDKPHLQVDVGNWKFGKTGELELYNTASDSSRTIELDLSLCAVPYFNRGKGKSKDCKLEIALFGKNESTGSLEQINKSTITFHINESLPQRKDDNLKLLNQWAHWGVFANFGLGNSIHPKQIMTLRSLDHVLKKFEKEEHISIAYIGPDTTENLRSVARYLQSSAPRKIVKLTVYRTPEWDDHWVQEFTHLYPVDKLDLKGIEYNFRKLSEKDDGSDVEPHDITICTYVTPWIKETDLKAHKSRIERLLEGENSVLLAIDPLSSQSIVRNAISKQINANHVYEDILGLRSNKIHTAKSENNQSLVWRKGNGD